MVSAVNNNQSTQSVLTPPPTQSQSTSTAQNASFQQAIAQYTQDTTSGAGGQIGSSASGTNPSQTLSSDLMSSLLAMQS